MKRHTVQNIQDLFSNGFTSKKNSQTLVSPWGWGNKMSLLLKFREEDSAPRPHTQKINDVLKNNEIIEVDNLTSWDIQIDQRGHAGREVKICVFVVLILVGVPVFLI